MRAHLVLQMLRGLQRRLLKLMSGGDQLSDSSPARQEGGDAGRPHLAFPSVALPRQAIGA